MDTKKSTVYVAGFPAQVDENQLLEAFVTFGDILEINIPHEPHERESEKALSWTASWASRFEELRRAVLSLPSLAQHANVPSIEAPWVRLHNVREPGRRSGGYR